MLAPREPVYCVFPAEHGAQHSADTERRRLKHATYNIPRIDLRLLELGCAEGVCQSERAGPTTLLVALARGLALPCCSRETGADGQTWGRRGETQRDGQRATWPVSNKQQTASSHDYR